MRNFAILFLLTACGADGGGLAPGTRLVTGRIHLDGGAATQRQALQLVALYAAADCGDDIPVGSAGNGVSACAIFGDPFDPGVAGGGLARLLLPCERAVNVIVQTLGDSGGRSIGEPLALLAWATNVAPDELTTILAAEPGCRDTPELATNLLDLGELAVRADTGLATVVLGGPAGGRNPLDTVDSDGVPPANASDPDDDDDGDPDATDFDDDGDGLADDAQSFAPAWLASP